MPDPTDPEPPLDVNEYLVYELLASMPDRLARRARAQEVAARYERLLKTLGAEDQLSLMLSWLGRCRLVHKLDQLQAPHQSKDAFQVPDLLAVFDYQGRTVTTLIEVKTVKWRWGRRWLLDWKADYLGKLRAYGDLLGLPVLVAVWVDGLGMWTLVDVRVMRRAVSHYKLSLDDAMKHNLLGVLAGEFEIAYAGGAGVHIVMRQTGPGEPVSDTTTTVPVVIEEVSVTNAKGDQIEDTGELSPLLFAAPFENRTTVDGDIITQHFEIPPEGQMQAAYQALITLVASRYREDEPDIRWRHEVLRRTPPLTCDELNTAARAGWRAGLVRMLLRQMPEEVPDFLASPEPA